MCDARKAKEAPTPATIQTNPNRHGPQRKAAAAVTGSRMKSHVAAAVAGALITHAGYTILSDTTSDAYKGLVSNIKQEEGYKAKPYTDTAGNITIGYGTNLSIGISKDEAELLMKHRLQLNGKELGKEVAAV